MPARSGMPTGGLYVSPGGLALQVNILSYIARYLAECSDLKPSRRSLVLYIMTKWGCGGTEANFIADCFAAAGIGDFQPESTIICTCEAMGTEDDGAYAHYSPSAQFDLPEDF